MNAFNVYCMYKTVKEIASSLLILCVVVPTLRDFVNPDGWANVIVLGLILAALNFAESAVNRFANSMMSAEEKNAHAQTCQEIKKFMKK